MKNGDEKNPDSAKRAPKPKPATPAAADASPAAASVPAKAAPATAGAAPAASETPVEVAAVLAELRKAGEDTLEEFRERVARALDELGDVGDRGRKTLADIEDAVRENPWAALGIAAGAGLLAGLLLSLRR